MAVLNHLLTICNLQNNHEKSEREMVKDKSLSKQSNSKGDKFSMLPNFWLHIFFITPSISPLK